jgi:hypothetical protein
VEAGISHAAERSSFHYPSDLTDVLNGIFYVLWTDRATSGPAPRQPGPAAIPYGHRALMACHPWAWPPTPRSAAKPKNTGSPNSDSPRK